MRRVTLPTAAVGVLVGASAAIALGSSLTQNVFATPAARPLTAGSPGRPQGLRLAMAFGYQGLSPAEQPTLVRLDLWFPRGSVYNGARYPICSALTLDRSGPAGCPKGSVMGSGTATGYADTTVTRPQITVVNGGPTAAYFYTVLNNPARVQEPVIGRVTRLAGQFSYHLSVTIPENLRIVAGVPIKLTNLSISAGRSEWLATTNAPAGIKVSATFDNGATISYLVWVQDT